MLFAAFCAAETHDEKKPLPALTFREAAVPEDGGGVLTSSIVGVKGGAIEVDSLLFWCPIVGPDRVLRCPLLSLVLEFRSPHALPV